MLALVGVGSYAAQRVPADTKAQATQAIKANIQQAAVQCFAIEGSYPVSLAHLENNYNVVVNRNDYIVAYSCFASNMMPEVEVFARDEAEE